MKFESISHRYKKDQQNLNQDPSYNQIKHTNTKKKQDPTQPDPIGSGQRGRRDPWSSALALAGGGRRAPRAPTRWGRRPAGDDTSTGGRRPTSSGGMRPARCGRRERGGSPAWERRGAVAAARGSSWEERVWAWLGFPGSPGLYIPSTAGWFPKKAGIYLQNVKSESPTAMNGRR
jgi:hypothetical protein